MIGVPMSTLRLALLRRATAGLAALCAVSLVMAACASTVPTGTPSSQLPTSAVASASATQAPLPTPPATPSPTPSFTNPPDAALEALIPSSAAGAKVVKPASSEYGMTPGDVAPAYGDIGSRFRSLVIAYIEPRKLSLYAMRLEGDRVMTAQLRPYLASAGQYVGIHGLHPEAWALKTIGDHIAWVRPEDNATATATMIYTWAADEYVFLMIGTDDRINRAMLAALPGEAPPKPSPSPSPKPSSSPGASGSARASGFLFLTPEVVIGRNPDAPV